MTAANPTRLDRLEVHEAEDGLVVYDPAREMVHHLNTSAAVIFDLCDGTRDLAAIAGVLREVYTLDGPPVADARAALRDLVDRRLITWDDHAEPG